jgi:NAD(P)-dependent dehydrogenase (short-subunit alcohol dehydrogenase family)
MMSEQATEDGPRRALVTGASTGIGLEIALTLARDGYDVALTSRDAGKLAGVIADQGFAGVRAVPIEMELTSRDSIERGIAAAAEALGGLDVLVNNAATALIKPAIEVTWEDWDNVVDANLKGAYYLTCRFAEQCIKAGRPGAVVNIASTHGLVGWPGRTVYGISKGGMIQMARMLAVEWADQNIRINTVAPATVMTESREKSLDPEARRRLLQRIPSGRFPEPPDIAAAVRYFAGPEAASITGQTLVVDGGLTAV